MRWKQWVKEPNAVRDSLMTIRDKATHLLLEMRTSPCQVSRRRGMSRMGSGRRQPYAPACEAEAGKGAR